MSARDAASMSGRQLGRSGVPVTWLVVTPCFACGDPVSAELGRTHERTARVSMRNSVLHTLVHSRLEEAFTSVAVQALIQFKWNMFARRRLLQRLAAHAVVLLVLLGLQQNADRVSLATWSSAHERALNALGIVLLVECAASLRREVRQLRSEGRTYFKSIWNWLDSLGLALLSLGVVMQFSGSGNSARIVLAAPRRSSCGRARSSSFASSSEQARSCAWWCRQCTTCATSSW